MPLYDQFVKTLKPYRPYSLVPRPNFSVSPQGAREKFGLACDSVTFEAVDFQDVCYVLYVIR